MLSRAIKRAFLPVIGIMGVIVFTSCLPPLGRSCVNNKPLRTLNAHGLEVTAVAFSPNGKILASGGQSDKVVIVREGSVIRKLQDTDYTVKLWSTSTWRPLHILHHVELIDCLAFSPSGEFLAVGVGGIDTGTVKVWRTATAQLAHSLRIYTHSPLPGVNAIVFSPDGKWLATGSADSKVRLWSTTTWRPLRIISLSGVATSISFSPDGKLLATASWDHAIRIWSTTISKEVKLLQQPYSRQLSDITTVVTFSPDGKMLATATDNQPVKLWNAATGKEVNVFRGHSDSISAVTFSPDGKTLATASLDTTVKLWSVTTGRELLTLKGHTAPVYSVDFSPDGKTLATASRDGTVKIWNVL